MYLEPQPSLQCSSTEIDFTDPPEEVMNFSTKAGAVSQAWSMAGTVGKSFTAKVSVLGRLHLQVYDSVKPDLIAEKEVPLPPLPASHAFCKLFARDLHQTLNNPVKNAKLIHNSMLFCRPSFLLSGPSDLTACGFKEHQGQHKGCVRNTERGRAFRGNLALGWLSQVWSLSNAISTMRCHPDYPQVTQVSLQHPCESQDTSAQETFMWSLPSACHFQGASY